MAKNGVEGVYTRRPGARPERRVHPGDHAQGRARRGASQVMDSTAFALCMDNNLPIVVFNMADERQHRQDSVRRTSRDAGENMSDLS